MTSRSSIIAIAAAALMIGLAVFAIMRVRSSDRHNSVTMVKPAALRSDSVPRPSAQSAPRVVAPAPSSPLSQYKTLYGSTRDFWEFAATLLPAAAAGDADAQFYLSRVLEKCDRDNKIFFKRRAQVLSLDEGLQWASKRHLSIAQAQAIYDLCHKFLTNDSAHFGSTSDWLAKATQAGQPLGRATTALKALEQGLLLSSSRASGVQIVDPDPALEKADPIGLLREAVKSEDPEVLFMIGEAQSLLYPARSNELVERLAWWLVACERGLDCTANGNWIKETCAEYPQCQSAVGSTDRIQGLAQDSWPEVQRRAQEISAQLGAGQWAELIPEAGSAPAVANESPAGPS
jgi:hypothetical protein